MSSMNGIGAYQSTLLDKAMMERVRGERQTQRENSSVESKAGAWSADAVRLEHSQGAKSAEGVELSDAAKELLERLKEKFSNMDFIIADYSSDEEAQSLLSRGTKEYSVLMDPETLEKMATDESVRDKYIGIIEDSTSKLGDMKEQLGEEGKDVSRIGFTVSDDGTVSYFAELERSSKEQYERMNKRIEERREEKKQEAKEAQSKETARQYDKPQEVKRAYVKADSVEELLEKIRSVEWDKIEAVKENLTGNRFDFSV